MILKVLRQFYISRQLVPADTIVDCEDRQLARDLIAVKKAEPSSADASSARFRIDEPILVQYKHERERAGNWIIAT